MLNLKIGLATRELTPPKGVELCGYGYHLERKNTGIADPIYVRSAAFIQNDRRYLLVNCDLEGVGEPYASDIAKAISERLSLAQEDMLLSVIHTHTAPAFANLNGCGEVDPKYASWAASVIIDCACDAFTAPREVVSAEISSCDVTNFGYDRTRSGIKINNEFHALTFRFETGRPFVLLNYGCHPVAMGKSDKVSADYPGAAVRGMDELGYDAMFLVGFCGDVDPIERHTYDCVEKGRQFAAHYQQSLDHAVPLTDLTMRRASFDEIIKLRILSEEEANQYANALYKAGGCSDAYKRITDDWLVTNEKRRAGELPAQDIVHIRFFSIGPVMITGFSAEMTSELSMILSLNAFPDHIIFSMGNLFDTRRYIASTALVEKGAYEGLTSTFAYNTTPIVKGEGERLMLTASKRAKEIMA